MKQIPILFENDFCLVLNKPAGLAVQGGQGVKVSLDSLLTENYPSRPLLVHRLDRDTSGIILVAKTKEAARGFSALLAVNRLCGTGDAGSQYGETQKGLSVVKQYLGVCAGNPGSGVISLDLDVRSKGSQIKQKKAETCFRLLSAGTLTALAECNANDSVQRQDEITGRGSFSLLELELGTGRMHQIRRHLAGIGHPLLGDDKYGDFSLNKKLHKILGLKNLLLHASRLVIPPLPEFIPGGLDISAPLPDYFSSMICGFTC